MHISMAKRKCSVAPLLTHWSWSLALSYRYVPSGTCGLSMLWYSVIGPLYWQRSAKPLQWRHNDHDCVSNHQPHGCLLKRLFRHRSKKTSKLRDTGLCVGNSPGTGEFPAQMASNAENVSIWWRHHAIIEIRAWKSKIMQEKSTWNYSSLAFY